MEGVFWDERKLWRSTDVLCEGNVWQSDGQEEEKKIVWCLVETKEGEKLVEWKEWGSAVSRQVYSSSLQAGVHHVTALPATQYQR
jgi:hypothetical protein